MAKKWKSVHPGEILNEDFMKPHKLSMNKLALHLRVPVTRIADAGPLFQDHTAVLVESSDEVRFGNY